MIELSDRDVKTAMNMIRREMSDRKKDSNGISRDEK